MRFLARMTLTHFGARPRPLHFSEPFGFLYLKATFARLSDFLADVFLAAAGRPFLPAVFFLARAAGFWPRSKSVKSRTESLCFFKTVKIADAAALRLARRFSSAAMSFAVAASCLSDNFSKLFKN